MTDMPVTHVRWRYAISHQQAPQPRGAEPVQIQGVTIAEGVATIDILRYVADPEQPDARMARWQAAWTAARNSPCHAASRCMLEAACPFARVCAEAEDM